MLETWMRWAATTPANEITRNVQPALAQALGRFMMVDNQPGASGNVGPQALARSPAYGLGAQRGVLQGSHLPQGAEEDAA